MESERDLRAAASCFSRGKKQDLLYRGTMALLAEQIFVHTVKNQVSSVGKIIQNYIIDHALTFISRKDITDKMLFAKRSLWMFKSVEQKSAAKPVQVLTVVVSLKRWKSHFMSFICSCCDTRSRNRHYYLNLFVEKQTKGTSKVPV